MPDVIHIAYVSDKNYLMPTFVSAASAVLHTNVDRRVVIHLIGDGLAAEDLSAFSGDLQRLSPNVTVDCRPWNGQAALAGVRPYHGGYAAYCRIFMPDLFPNLDWILYADGDTLWLGDSAKLWALRDMSKLLLASVDPLYPGQKEHGAVVWWRKNGKTLSDSDCYCSGLCLLNLKKMRDEHFIDKALELLHEFPSPPYADQDVLNYLCRGHSAALPVAWGVFSANHAGVDLSRDCLVHYAGDVPWRRQKITRLFSDVVLVWHDFCIAALHRDEFHASFSLWTRCWRRWIYLMLKMMLPVVRLFPSVYARCRNASGIPASKRRLLHARFVAMRDGIARTGNPEHKL